MANHILRRHLDRLADGHRARIRRTGRARPNSPIMRHPEKEARTMPAKQVRSDEEARRAIRHGVDKPANAVKVTLDPKGPGH